MDAPLLLDEENRIEKKILKGYFFLLSIVFLNKGASMDAPLLLNEENGIEKKIPMLRAKNHLTR